jgi:hypothetical protein
MPIEKTVNQPVVNEDNVVRVARRGFPLGQFDTVMAVLAEYGTEDWEHEVHRVRLVVLKLAAGDLTVLRQEIDLAKHDFRDVLAYAEYPEYMMKVSPGFNLPKKQVQDVIARDRSQYENWLNKKSGEQ